MTSSKHITLPPLPVYEDYLEASAVIDDYLLDLLLPLFNAFRAESGIEPAPPPNRPPVTLEEAAAAGKKYQAYWENEEPRARKPCGPRRPTLASVAKQANKAAIDVARYEVKPDGTVVIVTGAAEPAAPENPWPLDEFRTKETKQ